MVTGEPRNRDTETIIADGAAGDERPGEQPADVDVAALIAERDSLLDQFQRARADYANLRRRTEQEQERSRVATSERLLRDLAPVLDDLQDAITHIPDAAVDSGLANGLRLVEQKFLTALGRLGVSQIEALGKPFDPAQHEAVDFDPAGGNTVIAVYRPGYVLGDALLRPAMVKVGPGLQA